LGDSGLLRERQMSGKKALLLIVVVMLALIGLSFRFYGYEATWHLWNIPTIKPFFADLRTVIGWSDAIREGRNLPLMDYPPLWLYIGRMGIGQEQVPALAFLLLLGYFISLFVFAMDMTVRPHYSWQLLFFHLLSCYVMNASMLIW